MKAAVYLVLFLGLSLQGGDTLSIDGSNSKLLAVLNSSEDLNSSAPSFDVLLRINVLAASDYSAPQKTEASPIDLESIIRAEINGDWQRARSVLLLASEAHTLELKHAIYEALWLELQQTRQIHNPLQVLDFYEHLEQESDVPSELLEKIYQTFVSRSAQLLSAPFYTYSRSANFPLVTNLMQRLTLSTLDYLRDILEALFDVVLSLESTLSVVQRLGNLNASLTQLSLANLELTKRTEFQLEPNALPALQDNVRQLLEHANYSQEVERSLRLDVYALLPSDERVLYTAQKVCLRNVTNDNAYIYECPQTYLICTNARDFKKAAYYVQRRNGDTNNSLQFAFYSAYWRNRYIAIESSNQTAGNSILKNVYSRDSISWWSVVQVEGGGVALYDAATSSSVLCGGNPQYWDGEERYVYTRSAQQFGANHWECIWSIEDCSDSA
ncbi:uncharacterized protein LOC117787515 [Drosophila innubila]|uniref:uncharacterized protein LOC117787515 n=1 Tax=Drosophila innubila TaxID=198719 RepID=UPI00148C62F2|nr:uncharacterized protein LOC117787515 [Drosophila innubila]